VGGDLPTGEARRLRRQERMLNQPRDTQLLVESLALTCQCLLFADELCHSYRWRGLRGQVLEQLPIVGRILLFTEPRAEV
jgi:hypothetical protein